MLGLKFALPLAFLIFKPVAFSLNAFGMPASGTLYSANRFSREPLKSTRYDNASVAAALEGLYQPISLDAATGGDLSGVIDGLSQMR